MKIKNIIHALLMSLIIISCTNKANNNANADQKEINKISENKINKIHLLGGSLNYFEDQGKYDHLYYGVKNDTCKIKDVNFISSIIKALNDKAIGDQIAKLTVSNWNNRITYYLNPKDYNRPRIISTFSLGVYKDISSYVIITNYYFNDSMWSYFKPGLVFYNAITRFYDCHNVITDSIVENVYFGKDSIICESSNALKNKQYLHYISQTANKLKQNYLVKFNESPDIFRLIKFTPRTYEIVDIIENKYPKNNVDSCISEKGLSYFYINAGFKKKSIQYSAKEVYKFWSEPNDYKLKLYIGKDGWFAYSGYSFKNFEFSKDTVLWNLGPDYNGVFVQHLNNWRIEQLYEYEGFSE